MKETKVDEAYNLICRKLYSFKLPPGSRVSDFALSKEMDISRTSIRQAMMILVHEGMLVMEGNRFRVPELSVDVIDKIYDARVCIETGLMHLVFRNDVPEDVILRLRKMVDSLVGDYRDNRLADSIEHEMEFRHELYSLSGNDFLIDSYLKLEKRSRIISILGLVAPMYEAPSCYKTICDCLETDDENRACSELSSYLEVARKHKHDALKNYNVRRLSGAFSFIAGKDD